VSFCLPFSFFAFTNMLIVNRNRRIYVDTRLHTLLDFRFNQPFFQRGDFPQIIFNGSGLAPLPDPWINRIRRLSITFLPYSSFFFLRQYCIEFYLIMKVGVGSTNGWFPDGQGKKTVDYQSMFFGFCSSFSFTVT
jgi:hypothetical protein